MVQRGTWSRAGAAAACAFLAVVVVASPALATQPPTVPDDVKTLLADQALRQVQENAEHLRAEPEGPEKGPQAPDLSGPIRAGRVHQIYNFTAGFLNGTRGADPAEATPQWITPIVRGSDVLGTVRVGKPEGGAAEVAGFDDDRDLAFHLQVLKDVPVVEDAAAAEWFALDGDSVSPLNRGAEHKLPGGAHVKDLQPVVAARTAAARAASAGRPDSVGGGAPVGQVAVRGTADDVMLYGGAGLLLTGATAARVIARRRRSGPPATS